MYFFRGASSRQKALFFELLSKRCTPRIWQQQSIASLAFLLIFSANVSSSPPIFPCENRINSNHTHLVNADGGLLQTCTTIKHSTLSTMSQTSWQENAISLMEDIYGSPTSSEFPKPMDSEEAGQCRHGQRRYLWTDAFAVLNYVSLAQRSQTEDGKQLYLKAAHTLADCVHETLGCPRSEKYPMERDSSGLSPSGFVGLRIGKVEARAKTDFGMRLDGMYWHYVDKWLFALLRLGQISGSSERLRQAAGWAKVLFPRFFDTRHGGIRWKLNVDATPISEQPHGFPNGDTLNAYVVYTLIQRAQNDISLSDEIQAMYKGLQESYSPRKTRDPLGWGLDLWMQLFLERQLPSADAMSVLQWYHINLPFRLYGALLGARLRGIAESHVNSFIQKSIDVEAALKQRGGEEHSAINRVMLASVLLAPGAFAPLPNESAIKF